MAAGTSGRGNRFHVHVVMEFFFLRLRASTVQGWMDGRKAGWKDGWAPGGGRDIKGGGGRACNGDERAEGCLPPS